MTELAKAELMARLRDHEDQFTERKLEGAGATAFKKAIVSFANSLPQNRTGILFVGIDDRGNVKGVEDANKLQRTLRHLAEKDCYPPIYIDLDVLARDGGSVVAAIVSYSDKRPHFAGVAWVRRGSESIAATEPLYRELLLSQDDKRRYLIENKEASWTVEFLNKAPGDAQQLFEASARSSSECRIEEITAFFVRFRDTNGIGFTEILQDIHISYDDKKHRPRLLVWPAGRG